MPAKFSQEICAELAETAKKIATAGKGILAADESTGTMGKRLASIGVENVEAKRLEFRHTLFTAEGVEKYISGVILFEETLYQKTTDGTPLVDILKKKGIVPGIKVDKGIVVLPGTDAEVSTAGLDGLGGRCAEYYKAGARFAKWRAVLNIDTSKGKPSMLSINETAHTLARYAATCQENKIVPIVEPEILSDGMHSVEDCAEATEKVLAAVFKALNDHHVLLEGCLLKPNMVTPGSDCPKKSNPDEIAFFTNRTLSRTVPPALVSVNFLSGGQSEEESTLNLNAMNRLKTKNQPWALSFSYGRALQSSALKAWKGLEENKKACADAFMKRAEGNGLAQKGQYVSKGAPSTAGESLFEKNYVY